MNDNTVTIIVACIGLIGTIISAVLGFYTYAKKQNTQNALRDQKNLDQLNQLYSEMTEIKKRLEEHNHYAEKIGNIEKSIVSISKDIEYIRKEK